MLSAIEQSENFSIEDRQLATSILIPKDIQESLGVISSQSYYNDGNMKQAIEKSNQIFREEGTVGSCVDLLIEFSITDMFHEKTKVQAIDKILEYFNDNVNYGYPNIPHGIKHLARQASYEYFVSGNAFPYSNWSKDVKIEKSTRKAELPMGITFLNPQAISMRPGSLMGEKEIMYSSRAKMSIPKANGKYVLDNDLIWHMKRRSRDYENWGLPYLTRCFHAIDKIKKLRKLDQCIINGIVHLITIFRVGTEDHPASPSRIAMFRNMLKNPSASMTMVFGHDVDALTVAPDGNILGMKDRYTDAYDELIRALGFPYGILGNAQIKIDNFLVIIQRLNEFRDLFRTYMNKIYRQICERNGHAGLSPKLQMNPIRLEDDISIKRLILDFYDRGLIGFQTALENANYNFDDILESKLANKKHEDDFLPPVLPFSNSQDNKTGTRPETKKYDNQSKK